MAGFSLAAKRKSPLHPLFTGVWESPCPKKWGTSNERGEKYTLDIRPTFIDELDRAAAYIEQHLLNPVAADKLISDVYEAIDQALVHPLVTAPRYRTPDVRQPYYTIQVGNYTVYYIVHDHVMEARWFRYSRSTRGLSSNPV